MTDKQLATILLASIFTVVIFLLATVMVFVGETLGIRITAFICCIAISIISTILAIMIINNLEDNE